MSGAREVQAGDREAALLKQWQPPQGLGGWFTVVNNQILGKRYMATALIFFALGGFMALLMRIQLAVPENQFLGPAAFNELFTMHGTTMMYLFTVPFLEGLAVWLVPLMIGSRDLAFPRLSAFGYWCYLLGGLVIYASFFVGEVPDAGWFAYTPLSGPKYSGLGLDFWVLGLGLLEVAGLAAAAELVVTILKLRAAGMALHRMPLFVWTILAAMIMILFGFTPLLVATAMLEMDRTLGTRFFDPDGGGSTLLWQHLFWFFGHPEVYIAFLPATGIVSMVIPTAARRPIVAYSLVVASIILIAFVSFGLWVHHMFATGLPQLSLLFFAAASLAIALGSGTQIFAWIATLWGSRPRLHTPMLWVVGFIVIFVLGGLTGVMVAVVPFDLQVHDTYFVVAHFHYVLIGGVVFPIFAGLHLWFPKLTGRMAGEPAGKGAFWLTFIGFNVTFFPMHLMGFFGMPRRVYTYPSLLDLGIYNMIATAGAFVLALGFVVMVVNLLWSLRRGEAAPADPWGGETLEWSLPSPPPIYSFDQLPAVGSRHPQWDPPLTPPPQIARDEPTRWRTTLISDAVTGKPQAFAHLPGPTPLPAIAAAGLTLASIGILIKGPILATTAGIFTAAVIARWLWPDAKQMQSLRPAAGQPTPALPWVTHGACSPVWWGVVTLLTILATALGTLLYSCFYLELYSERWPQDGLPHAPWLWPSIATVTLLCAAAASHWAKRRMHDMRAMSRLVLGVAAALTLLVPVVLIAALVALPFGPQINAYASILFVMNWFVIGVSALAGAIAGTAAYRAVDAEDPTVKLHLEINVMLAWFGAAAAALVLFALVVWPRIV